ncbi:MAG: DUF3084 domain-containing protein [Leptolyngbyaceae cyanobacterium]
MSSGVILILAVLILGGVIATLGDRLGTRVGKARLSLFNLRPRRTATLVTILTGVIVAASTLGILFAVSDSLRTGVFELNSIQRRLRRTRADLKQANQEKDTIETELKQTRRDRGQAQKQLGQAQKRLGDTNRSLQVAIAERSRAQSQTQRIQTQLLQTQGLLATVSQQISKLRIDINQLQTERDQVIAERNQVISKRDQEIQARDRVIQQRELRLKDLEAQQEFLAREVQKLELEAQGLRRGNVAVQRGQVLASAVIRNVDPTNARPVVDQLLREANRMAIQLVRPGSDGQLIQITKPAVDQLINQIDDGQEYLVRMISAENYLTGEPAIQVFADATRNRVVLLAGDVVAATSIDPSTMDYDQLQKRIQLLLAAANFRARSLGIQADSIEIGRIQNLIAFVEQLRQYNKPLEVKVIAADVTPVSGPLRLEFVATQDGNVVLRSQS